MVNSVCKSRERASGIEALKIAAIFLITLSHVVQTLHAPNTYIPYTDYVLNLKHATTDAQLLTLSMFRYFGNIGNMIFFVCSAWFLLESNKNYGKKIFFMLTEIWFVSIVILVAALVVGGLQIDKKIMVKCLFPTLFANNWYMTCYMVFCAIHPALNKLIAGMDRKALSQTVIILLAIYVVANYVKHGAFFYSSLVLWIAVYFLIAYLKFYLPELSSQKRFNLLLLLIGVVGNFGLVLLTNLLGLRFDFLSNQLLYWNTKCSPFAIMIAVSLLNLLRGGNYRNSTINKISALSMLIYIIHENLIVRTYARPCLWEWIYKNLGYSHVLLWALLSAVGIFVFTALVARLWQVTVQRHIRAISERLYLCASRVCEMTEKRINSLS